MQGETATRTRVLVVEDEPSLRALTVEVLAARGLACVTAGDAAEARARLAERPTCQLMLCDVNMPGESGLELVRDTLAKRDDIAVVMVSGVDDPSVAEAALGMGAYGYVTKPFTPNELLINVDNALRRQTLELENRSHRDRLEHLLSERTAALRSREAQNRAVAELGQRALYGTDLRTLFLAALHVLREQLDVQFAAVLELAPDGESFVVEAAAGWEREALGRSLPVGREHDAGLAIAGERPVSYAGPVTVRPIPIGPEADMVQSGLCVVIRLGNGFYGTLSVHSDERKHFSDDDVSFAQSVANVLGSALARLRMEQQIRHQALHDPLTGLPNRVVLVDRLEQTLAWSSRRESRFAVLFIDLDHFKTVNDSLGHRAGDQLLVEFAQRLRQQVRAEDTIARFGGDEFVVLCHDLEQTEQAAEIAVRVSKALDEPFILGDDTVFVTASIGIALSTRYGATAESLLRDADTAMYLAKDHGRDRYAFFDATLRRKAVERMRTETALRWALDRHELFAYYQPIVDLVDGRIKAVEALVRWQHPERGVLAPDFFVPLAEECGLIVPLGAHVLSESCQQLAEWIRDGTAAPSVAVNVNVAALQLADPQFPELVALTLERSKLEPHRLCLEITETGLIGVESRAAKTVERLKELGVGLVLDDFGTGYSSLSYLRRFPLDTIKLDRMFVLGLTADDAQRGLVHGIVDIAGALGLHTVVEGIETREQAEIAGELGCEYAQGFLFAQPTGAKEVAELFASPDW